jgi:hypothetical protein
LDCSRSEISANGGIQQFAPMVGCLRSEITTQLWALFLLVIMNGMRSLVSGVT